MAVQTLMNAHCQTTAVAYAKTFPEAIHAQAALMIKNLIRQIGGVLPQQRSAISSLVSQSKAILLQLQLANFNVLVYTLDVGIQLEPVVALAL